MSILELDLFTFYFEAFLELLNSCLSIITNRCDDEAESACECETLPKECARQVDLYPNCSTRFQTFYDQTAECVEAQEESIPSVDFNGPWFIACYAIISGVTVLMLAWCAWNQRLASVKGSTVPLVSAKLNDSVVNGAKGAQALANNEGWTQTAYKRNVVGMAIYALVILTVILIQYLLLALTVEYCKSAIRWFDVFTKFSLGLPS